MNVSVRIKQENPNPVLVNIDKEKSMKKDKKMPKKDDKKPMKKGKC